MEKGSILFFSGSYRQSSEILLAAGRLIKEQDQISILDQTSAVIVNDNTMEYKGEYAERLWVHTLLMMNFLLLDDIEKALVEAKQALEVYERYPRALEQADFTRALIALCYENLRYFDDAKIEYRKISNTADHSFTPPPVPSGDEAELVLFLSSGTIPRKVSREIVVPPSVRISLPTYRSSPPPLRLQVRSENEEPFLTVSSNLGLIAKMSLKERMAEYITRQAIRVGTKETLSQIAEQQDDLAGAVVRLILLIAEQADIRSWQTLPGSLTITRLKLRPGVNTIKIYSGSDQFLSRFTISVKGGSRNYYFVSL